MDTSHFLAPALVPHSIAVVGATDKPNKLGHYVFSNVLAGNFTGTIFAVNPRYKSVAGRPCVANLQALPAPVDLAIIVTPAHTLPGLVEDAGKARVRALLVLSAGFAETGEEGRQLQQRALAAARRHGIRLFGPNCLGLMRPDIGLNATFARTPARAGSLALVSQSGAVVAALLDHAWSAGFGFSSIVSTGGGSDVEFSEILDFLAVDPATRSIVLYIEGIHEARAFLSSIRAASSVKPVVVLKAGRHATGSKAALSHTGAMVGDDAVFDMALRRAGAIRVREYDELFSAAEALASGRLPRSYGGIGNRLAIITNGGGPGVLAADVVAETGLVLAKPSAETLAKLDAFLPATWSHGNPVDIIGDADQDRFARTLQIVLADDGSDGVLVLFSPTVTLSAADTARALLPLATAAEKPVVTAWLGEADADQGRALLKASRVPAMRSPEHGVQAFAYLAQYVRNKQLRLQVPPPSVDAFALDLAAARALLAGARAAHRPVLGEDESKRLLHNFGILTVQGDLATSAGQARSIAEHVGFPVVLKIRAEGVTHKSEVGGVLLSLKGPEEVGLGFELIRERIAQRAPQARFLGVLVQKMVVRPNGRELIIGMIRDPVFGPVITFGMGGIAVEVFQDTAVALPPLNRFLAHELIDSTRVARMLGTFRGLPAVDLDRVIDVLLRVSQIACELPCVKELDINPLLADEDGVIALDARVVVDDFPLAPDATWSHLAIHPYPKTLEREFVDRKGDALLLRPVRPEDAEGDRRLVTRLSARSLYQRFHAPVRELTLERLVRYTQIDYDREMAFVVVDRSAVATGGLEEIRGIARWTRNPDGTSAEFGIVVEDAWHGRGLGKVLMQALADCGRARGVREIFGLVLADNTDMGRLMSALGLVRAREPDDPGIVRYTLRLDRPVPPAVAGAPVQVSPQVSPQDSHHFG